MKSLPMLSGDQKLAEIKRLYYQTSRQTIKRDFVSAIELVKSMNTEEERERVAVYMDGLSQMRSDWARQHNDGWRKGEGKGRKKVEGKGTHDKGRTNNDKGKSNNAQGSS